MAEEHRCQAPRLCVNNCGFFGSPATQNLCSKCHRDLQLKEQQSSSAKQALNQTLISSSAQSSSSSAPSPAVDVLQKTVTASAPIVKGEEKKDVVAAAAVPVASGVNRCLKCPRRVGLTGFRCRCGSLFCWRHRYPEQHECTFDFKEMGKEQISKDNPVIKAEKLQKI
ncbi:zinc finger A20 and AN1 domain-containing stress-associated protein 3-like [Mangifera indica]|uniref:zinc finger A20 and AN1 domain-containing stress-associated protein 3-like n=1 Tax=Mangifera indica TaxID=29780 RepID=UPI001CFB6594|nr:zinc finger A20 and AN1 domain-containing stress-associated protein 3-like [Mangifera indica]